MFLGSGLRLTLSIIFASASSTWGTSRLDGSTMKASNIQEAFSELNNWFRNRSLAYSDQTLGYSPG